MRTQITRRARQQASSLATVLVLCAILSFSVVGYLALITQQSRQSARSQLWNLAIATSEAGVEEGLQQLNSNSGNLGANGWAANGALYTLTRKLPGGNSFTVTIDNSQPINPTITSRALIKLESLARNTPPAFVAVAGMSLNSSETLTRAVRVRTSRSSLFLAAMVAKKGVDLKGNGVMTDSFDSGDQNKSTNGHYDPAKAGDLGDVASNDGIVGVVSVQNANIYGRVHTGKGGTASIGAHGAVGSHAWQATNKGIQPGWATEDANFTFPDTQAPYTTGLPTSAGDVATAVGIVTNTSFVNGATAYPTNVPSGATISAVVTNSSTVTSSTYPGALTGLKTNTTYTTVTAYPGARAGLVTNYASFTTVTAYPGAQPGLTTNYLNATKKKITGYSYATGFNYTYPTHAYSYSVPAYNYNLTQTSTVYATNHYDHVLQSGDYLVENLSGTVYVAGQARLVLPNGLSMSGNDQFVVGPQGSISVYAGGTSTTIGGNGVVNPSGFAGNFIVYCALSVTGFTLNGNGEFTGVLVAPNADIKMNGGGNSAEDFIGALMVNSVGMNGHFRFHYDEALSRMPANGRFLITAWDEIR